MANQNSAVIYAGMTDNLVKRVWQHKNKAHPKSFTSKYNVNKLAYYEIYADPISAIEREKQIKSWPRKRKIDLIKSKNPTFRDLYDEIRK